MKCVFFFVAQTKLAFICVYKWTLHMYLYILHYCQTINVCTSIRQWRKDQSMVMCCSRWPHCPPLLLILQPPVEDTLPKNVHPPQNTGCWSFIMKGTGHLELNIVVWPRFSSAHTHFLGIIPYFSDWMSLKVTVMPVEVCEETIPKTFFKHLLESQIWSKVSFLLSFWKI